MWLYELVVRGYGAAIRAASLRHRKAAQWTGGRKNWRNGLRERRAGLFSADVIWVHCASYGEFEQGRPLIEALKRKYPRSAIALTFFSPSGFEPMRDWAGADLVAYLPLDTARNARDFIDILRPRMAVFVKYEFWLNYLRELRDRSIPTFLVSAVFKSHHPFFKWYGAIFRRSLRTFRQLYIQDEASGRLLSRIGIANYTVTGDTRVDRVIEIRDHFAPIGPIEKFKMGARLIIAGSTWPSDEDLVIDAWKKLDGENVKLLLVPHEVNPRAIESLHRRLEKAGVAYTTYSRNDIDVQPVMVLDTMGLLARSYHYADVAYIGGGFDSGIHNILEAAVYGIPVTYYGITQTKFNEAVALGRLGAAIPVSDARHLANEWKALLSGPEKMRSISQALEGYFAEHANSTARILAGLEMEE